MYYFFFYIIITSFLGCGRFLLQTWRWGRRLRRVQFQGTPRRMKQKFGHGVRIPPRPNKLPAGNGLGRMKAPFPAPFSALLSRKASHHFGRTRFLVLNARLSLNQQDVRCAAAMVYDESKGGLAQAEEFQPYSPSMPLSRALLGIVAVRDPSSCLPPHPQQTRALFYSARPQKKKKYYLCETGNNLSVWQARTLPASNKKRTLGSCGAAVYRSDGTFVLGDGNWWGLLYQVGRKYSKGDRHAPKKAGIWLRQGAPPSPFTLHTSRQKLMGS